MLAGLNVKRMFDTNDSREPGQARAAASRWLTVSGLRATFDALIAIFSA